MAVSQAAARAKEAPPSFFCPINGEIMRNLVSRVDGHCYECVDIEQWFAAGNTTSPNTGLALPSTTLTRNHALRNAIEEWELANCQLIRRADITPSAFNRSTQIGAGSFKEVHKAEMVRAGASTAIPVVAVLKVRRGDIAEEAEMLLGLGICGMPSWLVLMQRTHKRRSTSSISSWISRSINLEK